MSIRKRTQGFDTINESAQKPRGKGSSIPHLRGAEEEAATKALVSTVQWWGGDLRPPGSSGKARALLMVGCAAMARTAVGRP